MEPVGWVVDTVGYKKKGTVGSRTAVRKENLPLPEASTSTSCRSPKDGDDSTSRTRTAATSSTASTADADRGTFPSAAGGASLQSNLSRNLADDLLRRIEREASDGMTRGATANGDRDGVSSTRRHDDCRQEQRYGRRQHSPHGESSTDTGIDSATYFSRDYSHGPRSGRWCSADGRGWSTSTEAHSSSRADHDGAADQGGGGTAVGRASGLLLERQRQTGTGLEGGAWVASAASLAAEANPFTEGMWEDASCRQVLNAMYFATDSSAVPAGASEEYRELEGEA